MTVHEQPRVSIQDQDGRCVATADIQFVGQSAARASLHIESGHLPAGTRTRLVDALLDMPEFRSCKHVQVALPLGDTEILDRVRERCHPDQPSACRRHYLPGRGRLDHLTPRTEE